MKAKGKKPSPPPAPPADKRLMVLWMTYGMSQRRLPMSIGQTVFIRTVTHHYCGVVSAVAEEEVELKSASWIANDGRFMSAIASGTFTEVEPYPDGTPVVLNRASFVDWCPVSFAAPRAQKP